MQISIELKEIMQNSEFIYYLIMWNVIVYKWSILAMIDSKCMLQNFHESRVEPRASRAESTPGLARGSALQLALQLTSRANPLLGSARRDSAHSWCSQSWLGSLPTLIIMNYNKQYHLIILKLFYYIFFFLFFYFIS